MKENVESKEEDVPTEAPDVVPASEEVFPTRKISIEFARTVSDGNYGSVSAKAYVQGEVPFAYDLGQISDQLGSLYAAAKIAVFDELSIAYHMDTETGVIHEDAAAVTTARVAQALGTKPAQAGLGFTIKNPDTASPEPIPQWAIDEIRAAGVKSVFDNRLSRKGQQPWFKEAVPRGEANVSGTTDPMDALGFWPEKK